MYLLSTAPLLYRRDKRRTGQKKRLNRGTNPWLPTFIVWQWTSHNCYQLDRKELGSKGRMQPDEWLFCGFGLNFVYRYETFRHVRTQNVKHMYLIVWLFSETFYCTCSLPVLCSSYCLWCGSFHKSFSLCGLRGCMFYVWDSCIISLADSYSQERKNIFFLSHQYVSEHAVLMCGCHFQVCST